jgi:hypothetical protein
MEFEIQIASNFRDLIFMTNLFLFMIGFLELFLMIERNVIMIVLILT